MEDVKPDGPADGAALPADAPAALTEPAAPLVPGTETLPPAAVMPQTVLPASATPRGDGVDVGEVDDLRDVRLRQAGRVGIPVDRGHAQLARLRLQDRPALVAPGADEQDGPHGRDSTGARLRCSRA